MAGLVTGGSVRVHGCRQDRLVTALTTLRGMGAEFDITDDYIRATAPDGLRPAAVHTDTHPGFMTDWQTPLMVLSTQADGMSVLHETVYEDRLVYVPALQQMGTEIELFATCLGGESCRFHDTNAIHSAVVKGVSALRGAVVEVPDVRAGSSVIAAAIATGPPGSAASGTWSVATTSLRSSSPSSGCPSGPPTRACYESDWWGSGRVVWVRRGLRSRRSGVKVIALLQEASCPP